MVTAVFAIVMNLEVTGVIKLLTSPGVVDTVASGAQV